MDIIPLKTLFKDGSACLNSDARGALMAADVIIGVDVESQNEFTVFGTPAFEETVRVGQSVALRTVRIEFDLNANELDKLVSLVRTIKGR
jgi:hypothetical protein